MTRRAYGRTAWGAAWLAALERIDQNTNRLPRGRQYANAGRVRAIRVQDGTILANVQGTRPRPYEVNIRFKPFTRREVKAIREAIAERPSIASELSLGKLPESLIELLSEKRVRLFPQRWEDLSAHCSCPDWANPCKHLAAVYYLVANEFDKDPFILFGLRGLPIRELVAVEGLALPRMGAEVEQEVFVPLRQAAPWEVVEPGEALDLAFPRSPVEGLFALIPERPLFYPGGDFKGVLLAIYRTAMQGACAIRVADDVELSLGHTAFTLVYGAPVEPAPPGARALPVPQVLVSPVPERFPLSLPEGLAARFQLALPAAGRWKLVRQEGRLWSLGDAVRFFLHFPFDTSLAVHSPTSRFLNAACAVAAAFVRAGAFVPQVAPHWDEGFRVRYAPLPRDEKARRAIEFLKALMPAAAGFDVKQEAVLARESVPALLTHLVTETVHALLGLARPGFPGDKLTATFIAGSAYFPMRFEERATEQALNAWLARLALPASDVAPRIRVEPAQEGFALHVDVEDRLDALAPPLPLKKLFSAREMLFGRPAQSVRSQVLRALAIAAEYLPQLSAVVDSRGRRAGAVGLGEMAQFLTSTAATLDLLGLKVVLPRELARLAAPALVLKAAAPARSEGAGFLKLAELLEFSYRVAIGDETVSPEELRDLTREAAGLVKFRDCYLLLDPEQASVLLRRLEEVPPKLSAQEALLAALTGEHEGLAFDPDARLRKAVEALAQVEEFAVPKGLTTRLRPYQVRGYRWLWANAQRGFGACLADDMGLGKTVQVLAFLLKLKEEGRLLRPALVVCPTTLVTNWQKECERFAPPLRALVYHGARRAFELDGADLVISTYGRVRRDRARFARERWSALVLDEAQNIKNPVADQTRAVKAIPADTYIALSGTPVENRLTELWSIFDCINRGYLGSLAAFQRGFSVPIEKYRDPVCIERLRRATAPFILRRLKTDKAVISDLPEKIVMEEYCRLTKAQAALYQSVVLEALGAVEEAQGIERRGLVFKMLTALKQICNHPGHYLKKGAATRAASGKAEQACTILEKILATREKALVFTQYREMGKLLTDMLEREFYERAFFFHGGLTRSQRDRLVAEFQEDPAARLMVLSLKAGGTGLNLTAATHVLHYDLWWNPAVEAQATDRVFRIGQRHNVVVHRLITLGTFEEKIDAMLKAKQELANLTIAVGEQWVSELSNAELRELVTLARGAETAG